MNHRLTEAQVDAYLDFLYRSLLVARVAFDGKNVKTAVDIVDMLHNLPTFLRGGSEDWSVEGYYDIFVAPMARNCRELPIPWDRVPRRENDRGEPRCVYVVQHVHEHEGEDEHVKFIGVYSTVEEAARAKERLVLQPGFRDTPEGFHIDRYKLGEDHWTDGYVTVS